jgi:lipopolysaccharide export system permease protein
MKKIYSNSLLNIYQKYFLQKIAGPFLIITLSITGIAWLSQSLKFIDLIVNKGLGIGTFLNLSSLILPSLLWIIIPASSFIAIIYSFNKLYSESELVVFKSVGLSSKELLKPALIFCMFTTLFSYLISFYFLPSSYREFKDMQIYIRNNYANLLIQEGVFVSPTKGLTVYVKEKDPLGVMKGLVVHDSRNKNKRYTITAQEATLENTDKGPVFILRNGSHQEYNTKTGQYSLLYFDSYNLVLDLFNQEMIQKRWREAPELYIQELFFGDNPDEKTRAKNIAEGHYRLTWPLYNILFCLLAMLPFIKGEFSRRGNNKKIIKSSIIAIFIIIIAVALKNITAKNIYSNILNYFWCLGGIYYYYKKILD